MRYSPTRPACQLVPQAATTIAGPPPQFGDAHIQAAEFRHGAVVIGPAAQRVANGLRLLEDFLEHEVRIGAFFCGFGLEVQLFDLHLCGAAAERLHIKPVGGEGNYFAVIQINNLARVRHQRRGIARQQVLTVAYAQDER